MDSNLNDLERRIDNFIKVGDWERIELIFCEFEDSISNKKQLYEFKNVKNKVYGDLINFYEKERKKTENKNYKKDCLETIKILNCFKEGRVPKYREKKDTYLTKEIIQKTIEKKKEEKRKKPRKRIIKKPKIDIERKINDYLIDARTYAEEANTGKMMQCIEELEKYAKTNKRDISDKIKEIKKINKIVLVNSCINYVEKYIKKEQYEFANNYLKIIEENVNGNGIRMPAKYRELKDILESHGI